MNPVARIIRRNLLASRSIAIPSFGTLIVNRREAEITKDGLWLSAPVKDLAVVDTDAVSIIDYIVEDMEVDETQATLQYNYWLDEAVQNNFLVIEGVGSFEISGEGIEIDADFASLLNPMPQDKIVLRRNAGNDSKVQLTPVKGGNTFMVVVAILAALAAAAYLVYYFRDYIMTFIETLRS